MIDVDAEEPLSFPAVSKRHPTHPSVPTLWRWALQGLRGVRLETIKVGGRRYTSFEAIGRFAARLTDLPSPDRPKDSPRREREMAAAERADDIFGSRSRPES